MNRTRLVAGLGVLLALLVGARVYLSLSAPKPVEPRERIRQLFAEGKVAFESENTEALMELLAEEFTFLGMDKRRLQFELTRFFRNADQPRAELGELQMEAFGGRILVRTPVRITWRDAQDPNNINSQDYGVVEFEFRRYQFRRWWFFTYEDWRLVRVEPTRVEDMPL
ncbi:MAG: hypothetical protein NZ550_02735 [Fimbriimonadales bacterium]|nr:hypothetical protein [Fimbriimonadales bacterium]MDW8051688.1 hypothetical protein [Armatimonadota bacterium]